MHRMWPAESVICILRKDLVTLSNEQSYEMHYTGMQLLFYFRASSGCNPIALAIQDFFSLPVNNLNAYPNSFQETSELLLILCNPRIIYIYQLTSRWMDYHLSPRTVFTEGYYRIFDIMWSKRGIPEHHERR